jgi:hypothetical protein
MCLVNYNGEAREALCDTNFAADISLITAVEKQIAMLRSVFETV